MTLSKLSKMPMLSSKPMLYDDQIFVIYDTANKLVFSPSTDIEYLKEIIRNLESNKETLIG